MQLKLRGYDIAIGEKGRPFAIEKRDNTGLQGGSMMNQFFVPTTNTGVSVTPSTALRISTLYACVSLISRDIARLPIIVQNTQDHSNNYDHPCAKLLGPYGKPNDLQTVNGFMQSMVANAVLNGNSYARIVRNEFFEPVALEFIPRGLVTVMYNPSGPLKYARYFINNSGEWVDPIDMLHFRGLSLDGIIGLSPVVYGAQSMGIAAASDMVAGQAFGSGSGVAGFVSVPGELSDDAYERLKQGILSTWQGIQSNSGIGLLEAGADFKKVGMTPEDYQLLDARKFNVQEMCRWFNMPPSMVADNTGTAYASNEQEMQKYVNECLSPWVEFIEQELKAKLFRTDEAQSLSVNMPMTALLRGDTASRTAYYKEMVQMGAITTNTVALMEGLPMVQGGDEIRVMLNTIPVTMLPDYINAQIKRMESGSEKNPTGANT